MDEPDVVPAVASPELRPMVATDESDEIQVADVVKSCELPLSRVPRAINCCAVFGAMLADAGETAIESTVDVINVVIPKMLPWVAMMVVDPKVMRDVARPCEPGALLIVAIVTSDEVQVTDVVMSRCTLLEYVPTALNAALVPGAMAFSSAVTAMALLAGFTAMAVNVDGVDVVVPWFPHAASRLASTIISNGLLTMCIMVAAILP